MRTIHEIPEMQLITGNLRKSGKAIGFVPTMGYFHDGHISLMKEAKRKNDILIVSIFVNPTQFGPNEDYQIYPRDMNRDKALALNLGVDFLFTPADEKVYPKNYKSFVHVKDLTNYLCGPFRPGHFDGVATVVLKLFNIVKPHQAFFGSKDYQQARIIEQMTEDLNIDTEIVVLPTVREDDGLAMSSRNDNLTEEERKIAPQIYKALQHGAKMILQGETDPVIVRKKMSDMINKFPQFDIQYLEICDPHELTPLQKIEDKVLIAAAVFLGKVRLIDNIVADISKK